MQSWRSALTVILWACVAAHGCGGRAEESGVQSGGSAGSTGTGGSNTGGQIADAAPPDSGTGGSDAETCGVIQVSDYDRSCNTANDCALVFEGDACTAATNCSCPNALINRTALAGYHPVFSNSDAACMCVMLGEPACVGGVCVMSTGLGGG